MKGDFSRGHRPDRKRGERYRRVLLQQGRLVLDSDVAAGVDAVDALVRDLAADVGCPSGSPDLGFLVTSGPLLAIFDERQSFAVETPIPLFKAYRDHGAKFGPGGQERFPSLYVGAIEAAGSVLVRSRFALQANHPAQPADYYPKIRIWARIPLTTAIDLHVGGATTKIDGLDAASFLAYDVDLAALGVGAYDDLTIGFPAVGAINEAWIGMIEGHQPTGQKPLFWITGGRYYLDGLEVELDPAGADGQYPEVTFPKAAGFANPDLALQPSQHVVAYLEGWERLVTHLEDAGILEQALGGSLDTTVRTQALGQVKLAYFAGGGLGVSPTADEASILGAFTAVDGGTAALIVTTTPTIANPDPCAVPEAGGYTGPDNRLYRFEVHTGGDLGVASLKWSKNNGADLFAARIDAEPTGLLSLTGGADVRDGDLVELLAEDDDLGDAAPAVITLAAPSFRPADRAVGDLYYARTTSKSGQIQLLDLATKTTASLAAGTTGRPGLKVRRWHGLLRTAPGGSPVTHFDLGDGITIELSGASFRPGDYWQYEARKLKDNANGAWRSSPHGPERIFAPLALLRWDSAAAPLTLRRWYDDRFSALCELTADDIAYDGDKVGTSADTVQEAIDELYSRLDEGGCCDVEIGPGPKGSDDGLHLQQVIDGQLPQGGTLCLERGVYTIRSTITIMERRIVITGCPSAVLVHGTGAAPMFEVGPGGDLTLSTLDLYATDAPADGDAAEGGIGMGPLVSFPAYDYDELYGEGDGGGGGSYPRFTAREVGFVHVGVGGIAVQDAGLSPIPLDADEAFPWTVPESSSGLYPTIEIERCVIVAPWGIVGSAIRGVTLRDSMVVCAQAGIYCASIYSADISRTKISAFLDSYFAEQFSGVDPETLDAVLTSALEGFGESSTVPGSVGLAAEYLTNCRIDESSVAADVGVFASYAYQVTSTNNHYSASRGPAVRVDVLQVSSFRADEISSSRMGLHVPSWAYQVTVEGSSLYAALGIVFGAGVGASVYPPGLLSGIEIGEDGASVIDSGLSFQRIRVATNNFGGGWRGEVPAGFTIGLLFGPVEMQPDGRGNIIPVFGNLTEVEVEGNVFPDSGPDLCIVNTFRDIALYESSESSRSIRITGNRIHGGFMGMMIHGGGVELKDNTIERVVNAVGPTPTGGNNPLASCGVVLVDSPGAVVADNVIRLDPIPQGQDLTAEAFGIALMADFMPWANYNARIAGNAVRCGSGKPFRVSLEGYHYNSLTLDDNLFEGSVCQLDRVDDVVVRGNRLRCDLVIDGSYGGVVSDNVVEHNYRSGAGGYPKLDITNAHGEWQVENNKSDGHIRLLPYYYDYYSGLYGYDKDPLQHLLARGASSSSKIEELVTGLAAKAPEEAALTEAAKAEKNSKAEKPARAAGEKRADGKASLPPDQAIMSDAAAALGKILGKIPQAAAGAGYFTETSYDAQVVGNWARSHMLVGYHYGGVTTPIASYPGVYSSYYSNIQIIGNRAGYLIRNSYYHLIATNNMADDFLPAGGSSAPIVDPNYNLP